MSKVYYSDEEIEKLLHTLSDLTMQIDKIDDPFAKEMVYNLLKYFDAIHREALHRFWQFIRKNHPDIRNKVLTDYAIKNLLSLYDLEDFEGIKKAEKNKMFISEDQVKLLKH